jgi:CheY-like chemotaxis protein
MNEEQCDGPSKAATRNFSSLNSSQNAVSHSQLTNLHVLLVEDSPDNQVLFERILFKAGVAVDLAENGRVALELYAKAQVSERPSQYDAIIMDIRMPVVDGYQATRRLREQGYLGPIIALTAHSIPGERERRLAAGCSHFFLKPIDRARLLNAVEEAVLSNA